MIESRWTSTHWLPMRPAVCRVGGCLAAVNREDGLCEEHGVIQDAMRAAAVGLLAQDVRMSHTGFMRSHA